MTGRESQAGRPKKQAVYLGSARFDAPARLRARAPAPSRAVALLWVDLGTLWKPSPSLEDQRTDGHQSAAAWGRDGAGAAGFALDSAQLCRNYWFLRQYS